MNQIFFQIPIIIISSFIKADQLHSKNLKFPLLPFRAIRNFMPVVIRVHNPVSSHLTFITNNSHNSRLLIPGYFFVTIAGIQIYLNNFLLSSYMNAHIHNFFIRKPKNSLIISWNRAPLELPIKPKKCTFICTNPIHTLRCESYKYENFYFRHVAVDEECPGSSVVPTSPVSIPRSMLDVSRGSHGTPAYVTLDETLLTSHPTPQEFHKNLRIVSDVRIAPECIVSVDERLKSRIGSPVSSHQTSVISTILSVRDKLSDGIGALGDLSRADVVNTKLKWRSYIRDSLRQHSASNSLDTDAYDKADLDRKDSAVCLEADQDLSRLKEILKASEDTRRHPGKYFRPRRESSGYSSNLSTFDEDRRNSTADALQGLTSLRRRSSTKRFARFGRSDDSDRMPTTEIYRKVSNAGVEMPNIEEFKEIGESFQEELKGLTDEALPEVQVPRERRRSARKSIFDKFDDSETEMCRRISDIAVEMPNINEGREPCDKKGLESAMDLSVRLSKTSLSGLTGAGSEQEDVTLKTSSFLGQDTTASCTPHSVLQEESNLADSASLDCQKNDLRRQIASRIESNRSEETTSPRSRQRKRIVHQFSSPSSSSPELERIPERPFENTPEATHCKGTIIVVNAAETSLSEDPENERCRRIDDQMSKRALPKSIKVYQLLSTQSEDRGDEPRLTDRRTSLQITRREDESTSETVVPSEDKRLLHADSVPLLQIPAVTTGQRVADVTPREVRRLSPVRKLSSPGKVCATQRPLADNGNVGIRPIYPYCPYSPYGSPQGSPGTRRRPLRESKRVSVDNREGALQLNQYKLLDNIGQVIHCCGLLA